jgi:hypothetical protein
MQAQALRAWRVSLLRQRAHYLGTVEAPDERAAGAATVAQFDLDEEKRKRLAVQEQDRSNKVSVAPMPRTRRTRTNAGVQRDERQDTLR